VNPRRLVQVRHQAWRKKGYVRETAIAIVLFPGMPPSGRMTC
jgi:hypothetical protein